MRACVWQVNRCWASREAAHVERLRLSFKEELNEYIRRSTADRCTRHVVVVLVLDVRVVVVLVMVQDVHAVVVLVEVLVVLVDKHMGL